MSRTIVTVIKLALVAAFAIIATGCSFRLEMSIVPERNQQAAAPE